MYYTGEQEEKRVQAFMREKEQEFERQQAEAELEAKRRGQTYERPAYTPPTEEEAITCVRAGWKSWLDKKFESIRKRDEASGRKWG